MKKTDSRVLKCFKILSIACIFGIWAGNSLAVDNATVPSTPMSQLSSGDKLVDPQVLLNDLREKEKTLGAKEADLNAKEMRLKTLEQSLLDRENELKQMRQTVTDRLKELDVKEDEDLNKLAKIYAATKAKSAAAIFIKMDPEKAVAIFRRMNPSAAAKILNEMGRVNPEYASKLSDGLSPQPIFENK